MKRLMMMAAMVMWVARMVSAQVTPEAARKIYEARTPSFVAVQYVWESELGKRELVGAGVVVNEEGLIMTPLSLFHPQIPDKQLKEFKIIVPSQKADAEELDAIFVGRDERSSVAFVKAKEKRSWVPVKFEEGKVDVGDTVLSMGVLPKNAAYKTYLVQGIVNANLRGETPQSMVITGLSGVGSAVFTADGKAIGFVNVQAEVPAFLNDPRDPMRPVTDPPKFFTPTRDFMQSLSDPPVAGETMKVPWLGVPQSAMAGLNKDVAESLGLKNVPAVELGDIIPSSPAAKAGIKPGTIVLKMNGKELERGDEPEELPMILMRSIRRMKIGSKVTLSVIEGSDKKPKDVEVTLEERPKGANLAERYYAEDLGFSVREIVFIDTYVRKLPGEQKGVVVSMIKPQSSAATARLQREDLITEVNGKAVAGLKEFEEIYKELRKTKPKDAMVLVVLREGNTQTIRVEPPQ
jgi:serine protease Do